jgi:hypothetical protein
MTHSKPRELTSDELALTQASSANAGTAPLRIPPGTEVAVEQLNPASFSVAASAPAFGPPAEVVAEIPAAKSSGGSSGGKRKEK